MTLNRMRLVDNRHYNDEAGYSYTEMAEFGLDVQMLVKNPAAVILQNEIAAVQNG